MHVAAKELTGVTQIRAAAKELTGGTQIQEPGEPGLIIVVLVAAVLIGAGLVTVINLSHRLTVAMIRVGAVVLLVVLVLMLLPVL